jgi:hypothetical protein
LFERCDSANHVMFECASGVRYTIGLLLLVCCCDKDQWNCRSRAGMKKLSSVTVTLTPALTRFAIKVSL